MSEKAIKRNNKSQKIIFLLLGGMLGVILLIFGNLADNSKQEVEQAVESGVEVTDADAYAAMLEERVERICSQVSGVGSVEVFVSLKGGYRTVYAVDSQSSSSGYKSEIVMSGSGSNKRAVVTAYQNPEIAGVGIVCSGASNESVRNQIISLVSASLDIGSNKIFVAASAYTPS